MGGQERSDLWEVLQRNDSLRKLKYLIQKKRRVKYDDNATDRKKKTKQLGVFFLKPD